MSRLVYGGIRPSHFERAQRWLAERGWPVWEPTRIYHLRGAPDEPSGIVVDDRPFLPRMLAAYCEHAPRDERRHNGTGRWITTTDLA